MKNDLIQHFQCGVCFQSFNSNHKFPRILICGHTFCEKCISKVINKQEQFKCPICKCNLGDLRLGLTYKNYSLLNLMSINGIISTQTKSALIEKETYEQIVKELDILPKQIQSLVIKRKRDDENNPFEFDLIRSNKYSMRFFKLIITFQKLKHFQLWVKYSSHGFQECLAQSLYELKQLKTVKIVNAYDKYERMREVIALTANQNIAFDIEIKNWQ